MNELTFNSIFDRFFNHIETYIQHSPPTSGQTHIEIPISLENINTVDLFSHSNIQQSLFFKYSELNIQTISFGVHYFLKASHDSSTFQSDLSAIQTLLKMNQKRFYYFQYFNKSSSDKDSLWTSFPDYYVLQPVIEIIKSDQSYIRLSFNESSSLLKNIKHLFNEIKESYCQPSATFSSNYTPDYCPNEETWHHDINHATQIIKSSKLDKVVLCRRTTLDFDTPFNFGHFFQHIEHSEPNCSIFLYKQSPTTLFFSVTPEKLYLRQHRQISIDAIAGTRSIDKNISFSEELLSSPKDHKEHELVIDSILSGLKSLTTDIHITYKHQLLKLAKVQHLKTLLRGTLSDECSDFDLISKLQPTAAVGGSPRELAIQTIQNIESFNRGVYTGIGGLISPEFSLLLVLIRTCLVDATQLHIFSGAGIVEESDSQLEWQELNAKTALFLDYFYAKTL